MTQASGIALSARLARVAATSAVSAAVLGPLLAKFGVLPPMTGFMLFALALPFSLLAILMGLVGMYATRKSAGKAGSRSAWASAVVGLVIVLFVGLLGKGGSSVPAIHDITTDLDEPPSFAALANDEANQGVDLSYPHGPDNTAELQREAYPDLATSHLLRTPAEALELAKNAATELGWNIVSVVDPTPTGSATSALAPTEASAEAEVADSDSEIETYQPPQPVLASMEATASSSTFRFVDDIVVRIRGPEGADAAHAKVDIRSKSRDGQSDLGANAARIRAFQELLEAAVAN